MSAHLLTGSALSACLWWWNCIARASLDACVVVPAIWIITSLRGRLSLPAKWRSLLWLLAAVRIGAALVIAPVPVSVARHAWVYDHAALLPAATRVPLSIAARVARFAITPAHSAIQRDASGAVPVVRIDAAPALQRSTGSANVVHFPVILICIWLAGFLVVVSAMTRRRTALNALLTDAGELNTAVRASEQSGCGAAASMASVSMLASEHVASPFACGLFRKSIVIPTRLVETLTPEDLNGVVAHELEHIRRADPAAGALLGLLRAIFWFHPALWIATREWEAAAEEACDQAAIRRSFDSPRTYGRLLLEIAEFSASQTWLSHPSGPGVLALSSSYRKLRRRIIAILEENSGSRQGSLSLSGVIALGAVIALAPIAPHLSQPAPAANDIAQQQYDLIDLGSLAGGGSIATALNDDGRVVGIVAPPKALRHARAVVWDAGIARSEAPGAVPGGLHFSRATGISNTGGIVLAAYDHPGQERAIFVNGRPEALNSLPGLPFARPEGVKDNGTVVGFAHEQARDGELISRAFRWHHGDRSVLDLGTLGGPCSAAYAINDAGAIAGKSDVRPQANHSATHAALWDQAGTHDLGVLPGGSNSVASSLNREGVAAGYSDSSAGIQACLWGASGAPKALGVLPGCATSRACGVNDADQVVGECRTARREYRAFLWQNGAMYDLSAMLGADSHWQLLVAHGINNSGQIVGVGLFKGKGHAFLLTPHHKMPAKPAKRQSPTFNIA